MATTVSTELPIPVALSSPCGKRKRDLSDEHEESPTKIRALGNRKSLKIYSSGKQEVTEEGKENSGNSPKLTPSSKRANRIKDLSKKIRKRPNLAGILSPKRISLSQSSDAAKKSFNYQQRLLSPPHMTQRRTSKSSETSSNEEPTTPSKRNSLLLLHNQEKKKAFQEALRSPISRGICLDSNEQSPRNGPPALSRSISLYTLPDLSNNSNGTSNNVSTAKPSVKSSRPGPKTPKRRKKSSISSLSLRNSRKRSVTDFTKLFTRGSSQASVKEDDEDSESEEIILPKRYFAKNLEELMQNQKSKLGMENIQIPYFIDVSCSQIRKHFLEEEGLFRVSPALSDLNNAVDEIEKCDSIGKSCLELPNDSKSPQYKPHIYSGLIKKFLRELPEPLLGKENYDRWISCISSDNPDKNLLKALTLELPTDNYNLLQSVISLSHELSKHKNINLMTIGNLSRVIGPNILWNNDIIDPSTSSEHIMLINQIAEFLIENYTFIFEDYKSESNEMDKEVEEEKNNDDSDSITEEDEVLCIEKEEDNSSLNN